MSAHPNCIEGHVCQRLSGRVCVEVGCDEAAGTLWGPMWCPDHDRERLDRVSAGLAALAAEVEGTQGGDMSDFAQVIVMLPHGEEVWDVSVEPGETVDDAVAATQAMLGDQAQVRHPDKSWPVGMVEGTQGGT